MVDVLHSWLPQSQERVSRFRGHAPSDRLTHVFESPSVVASLVPSLIRMYVDIEFTERHNQFYEKFSTRARISDLFEFLWSNPGHR